jgi:uncharacterized protein with NAD-binding domain and iron-sulfur cluster
MSSGKGTLPEYRERSIGYERFATSLPGPYTQLDASMAGYVFVADSYCLQGVINHYLAGDADYHYFALPMVVLTLVDMPKVFLTNNPSIGHMHEIDGGYQIACVSVHRRTHEIGVALFMPYLWVNTGTAMATGREVLGFQKDVAISFSEDDTKVASAGDLTHIQGWVTPKFGDQLQPGFLARVHADTTQPALVASGAATLERLGEGLLQLVEGALPRLAAAINLVLPGHALVGIEALRGLFSSGRAPALGVAFIKQFRDSQAGDRACYQQVFLAPASVKNTRLQHLGCGHRVSIGNFASHPIADELGLRASGQEDGVYESALSFTVEFQLDMGMQAPGPAPRKKVAILGGGPAAMAAMMDLSKYPERYQLTLYQAGWRLGGKCASGRGFSSPLAKPDEKPQPWLRNQEHGLHMALGFYENFFDLLRQAYDNLGRSDEWALRRWTDAVAPRQCFTLEERPWPGFGGWVDLPMQLPHNDLIPGDRARHADSSQGRPDLLDGILGFVESLLHMATRIPLRPLEAVGHKLELGLLRSVLEELRERGAAWVNDAGRFVTSLQKELHTQLQPLHQKLGFQACPTIDTGHWPFVSELAALEMGLRFVCGIGALLEEGEGFSSLDDIEFTQWLDGTLAFPMLPWTRSSAFVRACYVLPFAYEAGNTQKPLLAAGPGARALLRILADYAGAVSYDFRAGMGECVIAPFYQTILRRSPDARFEFFSRVRQVRAQAGQVSEIHIGRQATTHGGKPYQPLVTVDRMQCFPAHPLYDQLEQGKRLLESQELLPSGYDLESSWTAWPDEKLEVLELGKDFDVVVLAMPPPALRDVTPELSAQSGAWAEMLEHVTGIPTIAAQFWMTSTLDDLGWSSQRSGGDGPPLILSYATPLQAGADMSAITLHEPWLSHQPSPKSLLYFCDAMVAPPGAPDRARPDPDYIARSRDAARRQSLGWMRESIGHLLPNLIDEGGAIRWELLAAPVPVKGEERFLAQYYRGNTSLSELYITTFPKTVKYRLHPAASGFDNLYLAGDWTKNNIEIGCLEGAILSGRMAARAILGMSYALYGERDPMPWDPDGGGTIRGGTA